MRKWVVVLILLTCFLLGVGAYINIFGELENDIHYLHEN